MTARAEIRLRLVAPLDDDIAALAAALTELEGVVIFESCPGDDERPASVSFRRRGGPWHASLFAADLGMALARTGGVADYTLTAAWRPGAEEPTLGLACPAAHVRQLAESLRASTQARGICATAVPALDG